MAVTIDDLPAAGSPVPAWSEARVLETIASALRAHHVPRVVGFFSGGNTDGAPATRAALEAWLASGFLLGNHTFSHLSASAVSAKTFEADVARDQAVIDHLQAAQSHSTYFRYPYLERGGPAKERRIRSYLSKHAYRIADVSVDFEDWAFSEAYGRCTAAGDADALRELRASYLDDALRELDFARRSLQRVAGRDVPLVLLLHANFMTAQMLDALLSQYERAGVRFIPLSEALADRIYGQAQARHGDGSLLDKVMRERQLQGLDDGRLPRSVLHARCSP